METNILIGLEHVPGSHISKSSQMKTQVDAATQPTGVHGWLSLTLV